MYKAFGPKVIYRGLNLEIHRGEVLSILGGSGVGKSVMLKMLIGLLSADRGSIRFGELEITELSEDALSQVRRRIAMLFQAGALFDSQTVGENVGYGLEEHFRTTMSRREMDEARRLGSWLGGPPRYRKYVASRSLGRHAQTRRPGARHCRAPGGAPLRRADNRDSILSILLESIT